MLVKKKLLNMPIIPQDIKGKEVYTAGITDGILHCDLYENGEHILRLYSDNNNFIAYDMENDKWKSRNYLSGFSSPYFSYYYGLIGYKCSKNTLKIINKYIGDNLHHSGNAIISVLNNVKEKLREKEQKKGDELVEECFNVVPFGLKAINKKVQQYMNENIFRHYLFVSNIKKGKRKAQCSYCHRTFTVDKDKYKQKEEYICPKCGEKLICIYDKYQGAKQEKAKICRVYKKDGVIYYGYYDVKRLLNNRRYIYRVDSHYIVTESEYRNKPLYKCITDIYRVGYMRWQTNDWFKKSTVVTVECYNYPADLELLGTINGINIKDFDMSYKKEFDIVRFVNRCRDIKGLEYLVKGRLYNLALYITPSDINLSHNDIAKAININANNLPAIRQTDITPRELDALQRMNIVVSADEITYMRSIDLLWYCSRINNSIIGVIKRYGIKPLLNYTKKAVKNSADVIKYNDYIGMCEDLQIDISSKSVRYPKDLKVAHDRLVQRINEEKDKIEFQKVEKLKEFLQEVNLKKFKSDQYCVIVPECRTELIVEGTSLNHCVGQSKYWENHIALNRMIFFVRQKESVNKPFVTMEIDIVDPYNPRIVQMHGRNNATPKKDVKEFANRFLLYLKGQLKKCNKIAS